MPCRQRMGTAVYFRLSRLCQALSLGRLQRECGFVCVHCTRWSVVALDGSEAKDSTICGCLQCVLQSPQSAEISVRAPFLRFFPALPRSLARCWSRARRRFDVLLQALRVWVSSNKSPAQHARGCGPADEISCRSLRRKHISALGAGHLASLRARVSRGSSGQKPTWRKSSWYFTKTPSA